MGARRLRMQENASQPLPRLILSPILGGERELGSEPAPAPDVERF